MQTESHLFLSRDTDDTAAGPVVQEIFLSRLVIGDGFESKNRVALVPEDNGSVTLPYRLLNGDFEIFLIVINVATLDD